MVVGASQHKTINVNMYDLSSQVFAKLSNEQPIKYDWNEKEGMCKSRHKMEKVLCVIEFHYTQNQ